MSAPFYSFDPCVCSGRPCGACPPYSTRPCCASCNDISRCSVCPGGGCSPCPAPVKPFPAPPIYPPVLPCLQPPHPCERPCPCPLPPRPLPPSLCIPCCLRPKCVPRPCFMCTEPAVSSPKRCSFPGTPVCCGCGSCGPCMPVW